MPLLVSLLLAFLLAESSAIFPARFCDFRAFYCSGRAIISGQDPYREHPLHECEHSLPGPFVSDLPREVTIPAPYPGYALSVFSLVARLPFDTAVILWTLGAAVALNAAVVLASRLTGIPFYATLIVLGFPAAVVPLPLGQPTLFVLLAIVSCAALLQANNPRWAAICAVVTLLDPHVGCALCAGLFVGAPRTRLTLALGVAVLAAVDVLAFGVTREYEYFHDVLPVHALVNVPEFAQFSTANLAYTAGLPRVLALTLGNIWYAGAVIAGIMCGVRLQPRWGVAALVFVPLAFAVFGGSHTHLQQLDLALPALLLVTGQVQGKQRELLVGVTFVACVPWLLSAASPPQFLAVAVLAIAYARVLGLPRVGVILSAGSLLLLIGLCWAIVRSHAAYVPFDPVSSGNPLAEVAWGRFVDAGSVPVRGWTVLAKLPTGLALLTALIVILRLALAGAMQPVTHCSAAALPTLDKPFA